MQDTSNIFCIWYPSGGFGHFLNAVISLYGKNFAKPDNAEFDFGNNGNSHELQLVIPKYQHDPDDYNLPLLDSTKWYTVLIDNGITSDSLLYRRIFPNSKTIRIVYDDWTWPIVAVTSIEKAMHDTLDNQVYVDKNLWPAGESWAVREKYFLYLTEHYFRQQWQPKDDCINIGISEMLDYQRLYQTVSTICEHENFQNFWNEWFSANRQYIEPIIVANTVLENINNNYCIPEVSVWTQAVVNYYIWLQYNFTVPANDYANWFTNTTEIANMLKDNGVKL